ncbi:hypothetical protein XENTR_v10008510 [Xenopus tropicalis]|nr:hypothetical protein XENTR_v10008510 [Xenopus tropicalis]
MAGYEEKSLIMSEENSGCNQELHDNLQNPFICPNDFENNKEKHWKLKACDKSTLASREKAQLRTKKQTALETDISVEECQISTKSDHSWTPPVPRNFCIEKESLHSYILQNRQMFREQFAADVKKNVIKSMETAVLKEEENVKYAEKRLEEHAAFYEDYLEKNKRNKVEAFKIANQEIKAMLETHAEIRGKNAELMAIKSDIMQCEESLKEYKLYEEFLRLFAPPEWQESENQRRLSRQQAKKEEKEKRLSLVLPPIQKETMSRKLMRKYSSRSHHNTRISNTERQPPRTPYQIFTDDTNEDLHTDEVILEYNYT